MSATDKITYTIRANTINKKTRERFFAKVIRSTNMIDQAGLISEMVRKNTTVTRQDIIVVLDLLREVVIEKLQQGYNIKTEFLNAHVSIKGTFASREEQFTPGKHTLKVNLTPARPLVREVCRNARLRKLELEPAGPEIRHYNDLGTGTENRKVTPGFVGEIKGDHLEMDPGRADHGIWFVAARTCTRIKVQAVHRQTNRKILFTVPASLEPGEYFIEFAGGRAARARGTRVNWMLSAEQAAAA